MTRRSEYRVDRHVELDQWEGDWSGTDPVDMTGRPISSGDWLVKAFKGGRACNIEVRRVREVRDGRVYMGDSNTPMWYPGRTLIVGPSYSGLPWAGVA